MGGKTKNTQRTKNNVKPSSSSRSAELLGQVPSFVGFSAHSELGLVPFAPGFATSESLPETFDANISANFQMIFRKMSKKDGLTKKKALQEFIELINSSSDEEIKIILPLWPKFYQNLATDTEHNVRELAQTVQQLLVSKCKKNVAPFLKQLVPVWLASHFDNYSPAASKASASFRETFAVSTNRIQEVCMHCQKEILEYTVRNLTFHTATTLLNGKPLPPEEAEQKYQRIVICSFKSLSYFLEHTKDAEFQTQTRTNLETLVLHQKFWSFSKHKVPVIKAAWFEFLYNFLQCKQVLDFLPTIKSQSIQVTFQNFDDCDPLVSPHIWGCILLLQTLFPDWYTVTNFQKTILPKLSMLLRNGFKQNATAIGPNLLPFLSNLKQEILQEIHLFDFYKQVFDDIKYFIMSDKYVSKGDFSAIIKAYFECIRFVIQKISNSTEGSIEQENFTKILINDYILDPIELFLSCKTTKGYSFFLHTSNLLAFLADRQDSTVSIQSQLLQHFWQNLNVIIVKNIEKKVVEVQYMENIVELMKDFYSAKSNAGNPRVKFAEEQENANISLEEDSKCSNLNASNSIRIELRQLIIKLMCLCCNNIIEHKSIMYVSHIRDFTKLFSDAEFYESLTPEKNLKATLNLFLNIIAVDENACEVIVDLIFDILQMVNKDDCVEYINENLLTISNLHTQKWILEKLLSYPNCVNPEVRTMLSQPNAMSIIENIAHEVVIDGSKDNLNLLHKCFFQIDTGEILISSTTVDTILKILAEVLVGDKLNDNVDACGSFIAQIMPVICSNNNASTAVKTDVFLKLFRFTLERSANDLISEDTLWEITSCWQDALSSEDIIIDDELLQKCGAAIEKSWLIDDFTLLSIENKAVAISEFILCSTENIISDFERSEKIDSALKVLLLADITIPNKVQHLKEFCIFIEYIKGLISTDLELMESITKSNEMKSTFWKTYLIFATIYKLVCNMPQAQRAIENKVNDDEMTADYYDPYEKLLKHWSNLLLTETLTGIYIAAIGDSLLNNTNLIDEELTTIIIALSEKVKLFMRSDSKIVEKIKDLLLNASISETDIAPCRSLKYLTHYKQYAQFEENALIILTEDITENSVPNNKLKAYINSIQYLLPDLSQRTIQLESSIMQKVSDLIWVKASVFKCVIKNNFNNDYNNLNDNKIVSAALQVVNDISELQHTQKDLLLYNVAIQLQSTVNVINIVEYINLLSEVVNNFPSALTIKNWDAIRIGVSSWVLSLSKSIDYYANPKVAIFLVSVYKLFAAVTSFINMEKQKSSTELLIKVIDEWEKVFRREVNLVLFNCFHQLLNKQYEEEGMSLLSFVAVMEEIAPAIELIDYSVIFNFYENSKKITLDDIFNFLLTNLKKPIHIVRIVCLEVLKQLSIHFIAKDVLIIEKKIDTCDDQTLPQGHYLHKFKNYIEEYEKPIEKYINEFSFKLSEIEDFEIIDTNIALSYLLLWDCIIYICGNSSTPLRSQYTKWLTENRYEERVLHFLFRAMPEDALKNHDSKKNIANYGFLGFSWKQNKDSNSNFTKYVCHLYAEFLNKLPVLVRKWWNCAPSRAKTFVDKFTTNYVSDYVCREELKTITTLKDKHENMQVTVHGSTREVFAIYSIDDVRMELVITLPLNYPLTCAKAECGKLIGGRATQRATGMQLTLFMTAQNGRIFDGLTMWKNDLDKKFEGVEECYVCYNVIHQDTCQLPKLTCKTCKKKFHGPCLYKWFTTSSKSTCPICRNVF